MDESVVENDPLTRFVFEHFLDQIEQVSVLFGVRHHITLKRKQTTDAEMIPRDAQVLL